MKRTRTSEELEALLKEQLQFLQASADAFDGGFEGEAKRLAVSIRVLLHDTNNSHSLLGLLGKKDISFVDTALPETRGNELPHGGLVVMTLGGSKPRVLAPLDDTMTPATSLRFDAWWHAVAFRDDKSKTLSRKDLILIAANQDGGAHVDPDLNETYARLSKDNSFGWVATTPAGTAPMPGPEKAAIRQIAHEVLKSLVPGYGKMPDLGDAGIVFGGATVMKIDSPHEVATAVIPKVGRNEKCPCGSDKKYKKCHGKRV